MLTNTSTLLVAQAASPVGSLLAAHRLLGVCIFVLIVISMVYVIRQIAK